jgi:hypothetical protein
LGGRRVWLTWTAAWQGLWGMRGHAEGVRDVLTRGFGFDCALERARRRGRAGA